MKQIIIRQANGRYNIFIKNARDTYPRHIDSISESDPAGAAAYAMSKTDGPYVIFAPEAVLDHIPADMRRG